MLSKKIRPALFSLCAILAFGFTASFALAAPEKKPAEVAAFVNGEPILAVAVDGEMNGILRRFYAQGQKPTEAEMGSIRESALEKMIKLELLSQASKKAGIAVNAADVDNELNGYKKGFPDEKEFAKALEATGMSEADLKKQIGKNFAIQKFIDSQFKGKVQVNEKDAKDFYSSNKEKFEQPEMVHARHILIQAKEGDSKADKERKREKLAQIKKELKGGADFADLAKRFSEGPSKEQGGDLGFFARGQMVKPFEKAAFSMMPGDVSDIVETEFGYHLIKLEEKRQAKTVSFDEAKAKITSYLAQEKLNENIEAYLAEAKGKAEIKVVGQQQVKKQ
ncbi:peptidylprolyl isomerase [Thiovibrio sp. JS02]